MKKLFLFIAAAGLAVSLNSCSSSGGSGGNSVSFKVNGTNKSFTTTAVESGGMVSVYGYTGPASDPTETISFSVPSGETGDVMDSPTYTNATDTYYGDTGTSNVTVNNGGSLKGTFSGTLAPFDSANSNLTVTNGSFNVSY